MKLWRLRLCDPESVDIELLFAREADAQHTLARVRALPFVPSEIGGMPHRDFTVNGEWTIGQTQAPWHNWSLAEVDVLDQPADIQPVPPEKTTEPK